MMDQNQGTVSGLTVQELKKMREEKCEGEDFFLLDVRTPAEKQFADIGGDLIPLQEIESRYQELEGKEEKTLIIYCHHGVRSLHACLFLEEKGFKKLYNLEGGIDAWSHIIDPKVPLY